MKKLALYLINVYQNTNFHCHSLCRFQPTCSEYMKIAIYRFGFFKGLAMGIGRILRCNPFGKTGIDLVPEKNDK